MLLVKSNMEINDGIKVDEGEQIKIGVKTKVPKWLWDKLNEHSKGTMRPKTWIIKQALIRYLDLDTNPSYELQTLQDALKIILKKHPEISIDPTILRT